MSPADLMQYHQPQSQLFYGSEAERARSMTTSKVRYEPASYPASSYAPSTSHRGSWPLASPQQYPVNPGQDAQEMRRRLSMGSQGGWAPEHTASRRLSPGSYSFDSDGLSASPSFQPSSPWSAASDISPPTPPLYATQDPYGRPTGGPISSSEVDWSSMPSSGFQGVSQSDIRTQLGPCDDISRYPSVHVAPFDRQSFEDMLISAVGEPSYTPPPQGLLYKITPDPSPSPPPFYPHTLPNPNPPTQRSATTGPRKGSVDRNGAPKQCSHCHATSTPLWRREPTTLKPLCNACGLYLQQRNKLRPQELIDADTDDGDSSESDQNYVGPECSHCRTHRTSVWRRSKTGEQLCNACGVYLRLRGKPRPLSLKKNKIKPRTKHAPKA